MSPNGTIAIADTENARIQTFFLNGEVQVLASAEQGLQRPTGVVYNDQEELIVTDAAAHCVFVVSPEGRARVLTGKNKAGGFRDGTKHDALFCEPKATLSCCDLILTSVVAGHRNTALRELRGV